MASSLFLYFLVTLAGFHRLISIHSFLSHPDGGETDDSNCGIEQDHLLQLAYQPGRKIAVQGSPDTFVRQLSQGDKKPSHSISKLIPAGRTLPQLGTHVYHKIVEREWRNGEYRQTCSFSGTGCSAVGLGASGSWMVISSQSGTFSSRILPPCSFTLRSASAR